jgi:hypothetical protein
MRVAFPQSKVLKMGVAPGLVLAVLLVPSARTSRAQERSIGGHQHDADILGVKIGMDVPTALQTIFVNSRRKPGQEKPDAKKAEGNDNQDIRVLYKGLKDGEVQILFAAGRYVKEIVLIYAAPPHSNELRLVPSSSIKEAMGGERYDDRYSVGFTSNKKEEQLWWRDEKTPAGYRIRVGFVSKKLKEEPSVQYRAIVMKTISVTPGDEAEFLKATSSQTPSGAN